MHLRFDDTNPVKEQAEFVADIEQDMRWLGYQWDLLPTHRTTLINFTVLLFIWRGLWGLTIFAN